MDRSRRQARRDIRREADREARREAAREPRPGATAARREAAPPASSRLILRRARNRRRPGSVWSRLPRPAAIADACGRALRRSLPAVAAAAVLAALGAAAWLGHRWLMHSPRFAIAQIEIRGAHRIDEAQLRARLPIREGDSVFAGLADVARAVRADPWIATAEVRRVLPHTIVIEVREHVAAAIAALGDLYLVDADGRPFKRAAIEAGDGGDLPIITGVDRAAFLADPQATAGALQSAIAALARWRGAGRPAIAEIHVGAHGALTLHTHDPAIAVELGAPGPEAGARIRAFDAAWAGLGEAERARARAIHTAAGSGHVTVAFARD